MPVTLKGSCRCGTVRFSVESHAPVPYQLCFSAEIRDDDGHCGRSQARRRFCSHCGTALWLFDPRWPELLHPFASAIDSDLPKAPEKTHVMLRFKASWVEPAIGEQDQCFAEYPEESIEEWHRKRGLWID